VQAARVRRARAHPLCAGFGLKSAAESIDNRADFKQFMQNYQVVHARDYRGPRREGPYEEGFVRARVVRTPSVC
jgi:hypothetical protein